MDFKDNVAIISGAASGMGLLAAQNLCMGGAERQPWRHGMELHMAVHAAIIRAIVRRSVRQVGRDASLIC